MAQPNPKKCLRLQAESFAGLHGPRGTVVITDADVVRMCVSGGRMPYEVTDAPLLVVMLGHQQSRVEEAGGMLWELVYSTRFISRGLPTWLLETTGDPLREWHYTRDERLTTWRIERFTPESGPEPKPIEIVQIHPDTIDELAEMYEDQLSDLMREQQADICDNDITPDHYGEHDPGYDPESE